MKPFLIIQLRPEDETANSEYNAILKTSNLRQSETERIRAEKHGLPEINLNKYSAIIVGGSPFDITTPHSEKSEIQKRIEKDFNKLFDKIVEKDFPFLGACSGNGLLGNYCGANISREFSEPVSGIDVTITEQGKKDKLLKGLPNVFRALVGHKEACDTTPPNATLLASSKTCPVQMFRLKNNIYSTQFHPEADANEFILRINIYKYNGYFPPENADQLINEIKQEKITIPQKILKRFANTYKQE